MKRLNFKRRLTFGMILIVIGNALAFVLHVGIFVNAAWIIYGLLLIINPVYPERYRGDEKKAGSGIRIAGIICIVVGILTRFAV